MLPFLHDEKTVKAFERVGIVFNKCANGRPAQEVPRPSVEISQDEFNQLMFCGHEVMQHMAYEQTYNSNDPGLRGNLQIYLFATYALGVLRTNDTPESLAERGFTPVDSGSGAMYRNGLKFFRLGCDHTWGGNESPFYQSHRYTCTKCGCTMGYDTSG